MALRRGLHGGPGAWEPMSNSKGSNANTARGGGKFVPSGPTNLDLDCKAALQQILRPSHLPVIAPWLATATVEAKRDMVKVARFATVGSVEMNDSRTAHRASSEPVLMNRNGRAVLAKTVPVSADRIQHDLLQCRHGSQQRDMDRNAQRRFNDSFAPVMSRSSVDDAHRLKAVALSSDESTKVLTPQARRKLQEWQVRGPEQDGQAAAQVMRSLRGLTAAVAALPTYKEHSMGQLPGGQGCTNSLHDFGKVVPKGHRHFKMGALQPSRSAPCFQPPPFIEAEEIEAVARPGGFMVNMFDQPRLQTMKNKERAARSKISNGGSNEWSTTYTTMVAM